MAQAACFFIVCNPGFPDPALSGADCSRRHSDPVLAGGHDWPKLYVESPVIFAQNLRAYMSSLLAVEKTNPMDYTYR